jgi:cytochrome c553
MVVIARKLTNDQIQAVAAYYAQQPPAIVQSFAAVKHPS